MPRVAMEGSAAWASSPVPFSKWPFLNGEPLGSQTKPWVLYSGSFLTCHFTPVARARKQATLHDHSAHGESSPLMSLSCPSCLLSGLLPGDLPHLPALAVWCGRLESASAFPRRSPLPQNPCPPLSPTPHPAPPLPQSLFPASS